MGNVIVKVNNKEYKVEVSDTEELREKGLQGVEKLAEDEGMLFIFDEECETSFWMKDTPINLDLIFINEDDEVVKVATGYADTTDAHTANSCMYVLEVNQGSGIKVGDEVEIEGLYDIDEEDEDDSPMFVLDENGESQMELDGGERIFSRKNTKVLVRFAKRAYKSKQDKDYKALGRRLFKFINAQNNKDEDFVELPK